MPPPWLTSPSTEIKTKKQAVVPLGDFSTNQNAQIRKFEMLMGTEPKAERNELLIAEQKPSERPKTAQEIWETDRNRSTKVSSEASLIALKRDGSAWTDEDGYATTKEPPAFRDGFNNILRVKPPPEPHLNNGLKSLPFRSAASQASAGTSGLRDWTLKNEVKRAENQISSNSRVQSQMISHIRASDLIHRLSSKPEIAAAIGSYFIKNISTGLSGISSRNFDEIRSLFRKEFDISNASDGGGQRGEDGKSEENPDVEVSRLNGEIQLLLNFFQGKAAPLGFKDKQGSEESKRRLVELSRSLGNAFVSLGLTLPAGSREESLRNDSVALEMGNRMITDVDGGKQGPTLIEDNLRKEVAVALGRALLHLKSIATSNQKDLPSMDSALKDRTINRAVGKLTMQLLEASAGNLGKMITKDPKRREILAKAIGTILIQIDGKSQRKSEMDRFVKEEKPELNRVPTMSGPIASSKQHSLVRLNKPTEIINRRPILGGMDAPPSTVPRFKDLMRA